MAFKDLLLHIDTYPDPTPEAAIDEAVAFAKIVGGKLTLLAMPADIPLESNRLADYLIGLSNLVDSEEARSLATANALAQAFTGKAKAATVFEAVAEPKLTLFDMPAEVARRARTHDLCLVPMADRLPGQREVAQSAIFGSGRPVLIYTVGQTRFPGGLEKIAIAWDGSACAASAVAAAMPLLESAAEVRILSVVDEKPAAGPGVSSDLVRHLAAHGIKAQAEEIPAAGRRIGKALDDYLARRKPDLLVMGAYGHSRIREFVLGGATEHVLWECKTPVLLRH